MINQKEIPEIVDCGSVILKKIDIKDAKSRLEGYLETKDILKKHFDWVKDNYSYDDEIGFLEMSLEDWNDKKNYTYCILDKSTSEYIGTVGVMIKNEQYRICELAYWIRKSCAKQGIVSNCIQILSDKLINELDFYKVYIDAIPANNIASCKVAQKSGFAFHSKSYHSQFLNGESTDGSVLVKLKDQARQKELIANEPKLKEIYNIKEW